MAPAASQRPRACRRRGYLRPARAGVAEVLPRPDGVWSGEEPGAASPRFTIRAPGRRWPRADHPLLRQPPGRTTGRSASIPGDEDADHDVWRRGHQCACAAAAAMSRRDLPRIARCQQFVEVALSSFCHDICHLPMKKLLVGRPVFAVKDAQRLRQIIVEEQATDDRSEFAAGVVVNETVVRRPPAVRQVDGLKPETLEAEAFVAVVKQERLTRFHLNGPRRLRVLLGKLEEGAVVEDVAVLVDLDE